MNRKPAASLLHETLRILVLVIAIAMLGGALAAWKYGDETWSTFASAAMGRIGLVMAALWLAWPSLQRPARWLPPGIAVACVIGLMVLAAKPRLIFVVLPAIGTLTVLTGMVRGFRGSK